VNLIGGKRNLSKGPKYLLYTLIPFISHEESYICSNPKNHFLSFCRLFVSLRRNLTGALLSLPKSMIERYTTHTIQYIAARSSELQSQAIIIIMRLYYAELLALLLLSPAAVEGSLRGAHGSDSSGSHGKIHFTNGSTKKRKLRSSL
jgi:hypothetical protein